MGLERRKNGVYYYRPRRYGRRVVKCYYLGGPLAEAQYRLDAAERQGRKTKADFLRARLDRVRGRTARLRHWLVAVDGLVSAVMAAAGWHRPKRGPWRRKRGANMGRIATTSQQWVPVGLSEAAGRLDAATAERAAKGDRSALPAVDAYLDNPAALQLWGDLGRRVLQRWVKLWAGDDLTNQRSALRFASDLRDRLAGPSPTALDVLLAERVVIAWVFLNFCESEYVRKLENPKTTWAESSLHQKRIDMAHRQLMQACSTLAKVRRTKLPEVLAVVNVNPPTGGR